MPSLFAVTLFLSAALIFIVEPMAAKMVLPRLGGSPSVWNTCLVFFQAALLAGYLYAYAVSRWLGVRAQVVVHLVLLSTAFLVLPVALGDERGPVPPAGVDPVFWLLGLLGIALGLPFVLASASAPLLQRWFAGSGHPAGHDPYFLYAASNLGSMIALVSYPFIVEPNLPLALQNTVWTGGYALLLALTAACGAVAWRSPPVAASAPAAEERLTIFRRVRWVVLALVPSSLLMGMTTFVTTDVAAIPLLWVVPLALYLLTFILVFARRPLVSHVLMVQALPILALVISFTLLTSRVTTHALFIPPHWVTFFVAAMVCHGELARDRPAPTHLTEFYVWLSVGGVMGGLFTALAAPLIFQGRPLEYPLMLVLACLMRPGPGLRDSSSVQRWLDLILPCAIGLMVFGMAAALRNTEASMGVPALALIFGVPALACWSFAERPLRFASALAAALVGLAVIGPNAGRTLHAERNFFGLLRVQDFKLQGIVPVRQLTHGSTIHGSQLLNPDGTLMRPCVPTSYHHRAGPLGDVFAVYDARSRGPGAILPPSVAVTGLGAGATAAYARPDETWTFYEIDPAVERVARDPRFFSYLADCQAKEMTVVLGDARLRLRDAPDHGYGLMVMDAFSSDAVPTHLLTREALRRYRDKRAAHGLLAFNISNRYLDLQPLLAALAADAGMVAYGRHDEGPKTEREVRESKDASQWIVLADAEEDLGDLPTKEGWMRLEARPGFRVWDDDFSNWPSVIRWK